MSDISLLAQELSRLGVRDAFGIPGEGPSLQLIDELERYGSKFHAVCHEAAAALMAGGYGRATGMPGVCVSIKGPGFANLSAGTASNWLDRNPVLSLSESYGPGSSTDRMHKRLSHAAMVRPVVKAYADNPHPDLLPQLWNLCLSEEPGPVHVDISASMTTRTYGSCATEQDLKPLPSQATATLRAAQRPAVIAGALATRRGWRERLATLKVPVFTTVAGKGSLDESGRWSAGIFTNAGGQNAPEKKILPMADLVVGLGLRNTEILDVRPLPAPLLLLDELPNRAGGLNAITEATVKEEAFMEALNLIADKNWGYSELAAAKSALHERLEMDRWLPSAVLRLVQQSLPLSTVFVLDTGSFCTIGEHVLTAGRPGQVLGSVCGRSMGVALPFGIGAALGLRGTPTVIAVGDGGVRMYPEAITLAVREKLPVLVLLMSDGYYSSIRQVAAAKHLTQSPLRLDSPRWSTVFHALGCPSERIESLSALEQGLCGWKQSSGPLFLELSFDADAYLHMTEGIR